LASDIVGDDVEVFCGLGDGDAGLEMAECDVVAVVAVPAEAFGGIDSQRGDDLVVG
jgi:nitrogenase molybdenum-iron protein alpha/beta subunit